MRNMLLLTLLTTALLQTAAHALPAPSRDRIRIQVCKRKQPTVRITPNPSKDGAVTVISQSTAPLYFYVFDVEGTLLHQVHLEPGAQNKIQIRQKGVYAYDVFLNDEGVEQGKITVQ